MLALMNSQYHDLTKSTLIVGMDVASEFLRLAANPVNVVGVKSTCDKYISGPLIHISLIFPTTLYPVGVEMGIEIFSEAFSAMVIEVPRKDLTIIISVKSDFVAYTLQERLAQSVVFPVL